MNPADNALAEDYMHRAIRKALIGIKQGQTPFGACIVRDGKILACEHNCVWRTTDITAHAEVAAIRAACRKLGTVDLSGAVIYSTCEPCPMCFSACHWARISTIVYGASIADAFASGFNELKISNRQMRKSGRSGVKIRGGVLRDECRRLFAVWAKRSGRKSY